MALVKRHVAQAIGVRREVRRKVGEAVVSFVFAVGDPLLVVCGDGFRRARDQLILS